MTTTLYRYFNGCGDLLYLGITSNFKKRDKEHKSSSYWHKDVSLVETEEYDIYHDAVDAEERAIKSERPIFNITGNKKRDRQRNNFHILNKLNPSDSGCVSLEKNLAKHFPIERPASEIEAAFFLECDIDNSGLGSFNGYAKAWRWSRKRATKFVKEYTAKKHQQLRN